MQGILPESNESGTCGAVSPAPRAWGLPPAGREAAHEIRRAGTERRRWFHHGSTPHRRFRGTDVGGAARRAKGPRPALQQAPCPL